MLATASFDSTIGMWENVGGDYSFIASFEVQLFVVTLVGLILEIFGRDSVIQNDCREEAIRLIGCCGFCLFESSQHYFGSFTPLEVFLCGKEREKFHWF